MTSLETRSLRKEMVLVRAALACAYAEAEAYKSLSEDLSGLVGDLAGRHARATAKLAIYENPNAPSSTNSKFNEERDAFRRKRGSRGSDGAAKPAAVKPKGPPEGHAGVSHSNKPTFCVQAARVPVVRRAPRRPARRAQDGLGL